MPVLYILEDNPVDYSTLPFVCGNPAAEARIVLQLEANLRETNFWQFIQQNALTQSEWRPSLYLLAAIALLSSWRMVRNRRNTALT